MRSRNSVKKFLAYFGIAAFVYFLLRDLNSSTKPANMVNVNSLGNVSNEEINLRKNISEKRLNDLISQTLETTSSSASMPIEVTVDLGSRVSTIVSRWQDSKKIETNLYLAQNRKSLNLSELSTSDADVVQINSLLSQVIEKVAKELSPKNLKRIEMIEDSLILYYSL